jgi:hypothetical protein
VRIEGVEFELAEYSTISTGEAVLAWANVSVEELIERGDAICARYSELEAPLRAALSKDDSPEAYERVGELLPQLGALLRQQIAELAELEPPTELTDEWAENLARAEPLRRPARRWRRRRRGARSRPFRRNRNRGASARARDGRVRAARRLQGLR